MRRVLRPVLPILAAIALAASPLIVEAAQANGACVPAPEGILAWWPLGEASGATSAVDIIGGHDASYVGVPVPALGEVGYALHLDGVDDCLVVPDAPLWDFGSADFTFEFWVSFDIEGKGSASNPGEVLVSHSEGPYNVDKYIFALAPGQLEFIAFNTATGLGTVAPVTPWVPGTGTWHHVALTRSGVDYRVYLDGELADTEQNIGILPDADATLAFGCVQEPWDGYHTGGFDEISIYGRALTAEEIAAIAGAGAAGKCAPVTTTSTTTSSTTSTTVPSQLCGDVNDSGKVTASDALAILKAAVGGSECDKWVCICNVDGNAKVSAADALAALKIAVGIPVPANCPC